MCGIVGVVSGRSFGVSASEADSFSKMLFIDTFRGWDSTGVFSVDKYSNVQIHKAALSAPDFLRTKEYNKFIKDAAHEALVLVGHNRAATRGTVKDANAHPFWVDDNIILVQNGTYNGGHHHIKKTEVDTEAVAHLIAEHDDEIEAIQKVDAAYVLVWYNVKKRSLYIVRNEERPLYITRSNSNTIFFASEQETLNWLRDKNNLTYKEEPYMVAAHTLVKITFDETGDYTLENIDVPQKPKNPVVKMYPRGHGIKEYPFCGIGDESAWDIPEGINEVTKAVVDRHRYGATDIRSTIRELLRDLHPEFMMNEQQAKHCLRLFDSYTTRNKNEALIALTDYEAANDHPNCRSFHVWGQIVPPSESENEITRIVVHWFLNNVTEADALQYVTQGYYEAKLTTLVQEKNKDKYLLTVFGCNPTAVVANQ